MAPKIAIDYDGICTDLDFIREQKINEFEYLFPPFSVSISKPRKGILEIVSILGLFSEISIITSRPIEDRSYISDWLDKNDLQCYFNDIHCCGGISKSQMMNKHGISILIDDKIDQLTGLLINNNCLIWENQTWIEFAVEILRLLTDFNVSLKKYPNLVLDKIECKTDLGASNVFILEFKNNYKLKLRVCLNEEIKERILNFLRITETNIYPHVAKYVDSCGLAILKTYIPGRNINEFNSGERIKYISKAGIALAILHSITVEASFSEISLNQRKDEISVLVCSADNYNMIVTSENDVSFIDLEACNCGSRWIDYFWAESLLCNDEQELLAFAKGYFEIYKGCEPNDYIKQNAIITFKVWLTYQLKNSRCTHSGDPNKVEIINNTIYNLWNKSP